VAALPQFSRTKAPTRQAVHSVLRQRKEILEAVARSGESTCIHVHDVCLSPTRHCGRLVHRLTINALCHVHGRGCGG
jgi:hypothetical protein